MFELPQRLAFEVPAVASEEEPALEAFAADPPNAPSLSLTSPVWLSPVSRSVLPPQATAGPKATDRTIVRPSTTQSSVAQISEPTDPW